jgi:O-antigen/teichoic acid export membrane protein
VVSEGSSIGAPVSSDRRLALGAIASGAVNVVKVGLQLVLLPVMARLLGPAEFGIYALVLPTVSFVALLADGGLGATLAREPESSTLVWSSAFWILLLTGFVLALLSTAFGFVLGYVVEQPRVPPMMALLSLSLIFLVLSVLPGARLNRRRNLAVGAFAELTANITGAVLAVVLATAGAGAWSLVAQYLSTYVIRALVLNVAAFEVPRLVVSFGAVKSHMVSGGLLVGSRLCEYAGRVSENIGVERIFGTALLGDYTFANQISKFVGESIGNVTWGTLYVQALTSEQVKVVALHRQLTRLLAAVLFPASAVAAAAAPELIDLLLGPKWIELTFLLRVLLPASSLVMIATQIGAVLLANGRFIIQFWCATGMALGRVVVVFAGPWLGLEGTIFGLAGVSVLYSIAILAFSVSSTGCVLLPLLRGLIGPTISSLVAAGVCLLAIRANPPSTAYTLLSLAMGTVAFLVCMLIIDRKSLIEDWEAVRRLAGRSDAVAMEEPVIRPTTSISQPRSLAPMASESPVSGMDLSRLSNRALLMLYQTVRLALREDDRISEGPAYFDIRGNSDWRSWTNEIAAELSRRGVAFERIRW